MRALLIGLLALGAAGCPAANSQERYTYPGCDDAGSYGCPRLLVFACALKSIQEKHGACQSAADCVLVRPSNCVGILTYCPPAAVNDGGAAAFLSEADTEARRYCDGGTCFSSGSCGSSYTLGLTDCRGGKCVAVSDDGGF